MADATPRPPEAAAEETNTSPRRTHAMKTLIEHLRQAQEAAEAEAHANAPRQEA